MSATLRPPLIARLFDAFGLFSSDKCRKHGSPRARLNFDGRLLNNGAERHYWRIDRPRTSQLIRLEAMTDFDRSCFRVLPAERFSLSRVPKFPFRPAIAFIPSRSQTKLCGLWSGRSASPVGSCLTRSAAPARRSLQRRTLAAISSGSNSTTPITLRRPVAFRTRRTSGWRHMPPLVAAAFAVAQGRSTRRTSFFRRAACQYEICRAPAHCAGAL